MFHNLVIGARKSTLAKLQAYHVGIELLKLNPEINIGFRFQESSGDKDLTSPLWKMEGKGVFTRDLQEELLKRNIHCIVHSWKDLDLEERSETTVHSVLEREDQRDVFLFKKSIWDTSCQSDSLPEKLIICTSSPRREYNLKKFFPNYLPKRFQNLPIEFTSIRGNIQTRMKKFLEGEYHGLIMAKAGIDRLLGFPNFIKSLNPSLQKLIPQEDVSEFQEISHLIRSYLDQMKIMVLPLSMNPNAPAQGSLAVEVLRKDRDLATIFAGLSHQPTESDSLLERKILGQFGGGCHQKIGVAVLTRKWGTIRFTRGLTDSGETLRDRWVTPHNAYNTEKFESKGNLEESYPTFLQEDEVWPPQAIMPERKRSDRNVSIPRDRDLFVARKSALQESHTEILRASQANSQFILWTAGTSTWKDLAARDLWVHGTTDSLGESEEANVETLWGRETNFTKLTHNLSRVDDSPHPILVTYDVSGYDSFPPVNPHKIKAAFWRSGSEYDFVTEKYPELKSVVHYCGVGSTFAYLKSKGLNPIPFYNFQDWSDSIKHPGKKPIILKE